MKPLNILLVQPYANEVGLFEKAFGLSKSHKKTKTGGSPTKQSAKESVNIDVAGTLRQCAGKFVEGNSYDIIFLDIDLPDAYGIEVLKAYFALKTDATLVVLTDVYDEDIISFALKKGAQDYMIKSRLNAENILRITEYSMMRHKLKRELEIKVAALELANTVIQEQAVKMMSTGEDIYKPTEQAIENGRKLYAVDMPAQQKMALNKLMMQLGLTRDLAGTMADEGRSSLQKSTTRPKTQLQKLGDSVASQTVEQSTSPGMVWM